MNDAFSEAVDSSDVLNDWTEAVEAVIAYFNLLCQNLPEMKKIGILCHMAPTDDYIRR